MSEAKVKIVMENMILLDSAGGAGKGGDTSSYSYPQDDQSAGASSATASKGKKKTKKDEDGDTGAEMPTEEPPVAEDISDDIPF
jgi:single-stranded DNA-binding protein